MRIPLSGIFVYLPLFHILVEERAAPRAVHPICCSVLGERRLLFRRQVHGEGFAPSTTIFSPPLQMSGLPFRIHPALQTLSDIVPPLALKDFRPCYRIPDALGWSKASGAVLRGTPLAGTASQAVQTPISGQAVAKQNYFTSKANFNRKHKVFVTKHL